MARIFITGSSDGLGLMAAQLLIRDGHEVVLHARNRERGEQALMKAGAGEVLIGDLSDMEQTKSLAAQVNDLGIFDAVIHNAGIGYQESSRGETVDGLPAVFAINSLAPYILTCLIRKPQRLIYLSSGLHRQGNPDISDLGWTQRNWNGMQAYSDSKLHDVWLAFAAARKWTGVYSNALEPGWVATKMGGPHAPDSLEEGPETQVWLSASNEKEAQVSGKYFFHKHLHGFHPAAADTGMQDAFLQACEQISGVKFPEY